MTKSLSALYYPFSRPIDGASLKQMLLVFESIAFLDPVEDDSWRAHLFRQLEGQEDSRFHSYREVSRQLPLLLAEGAVSRVDPARIRSLQSPVTTAAALSDLLDPGWTSVASKPDRFKLPHRNLGGDGSPTWQVFLQKMPITFIDALRSTVVLQRHLVREGDENQSWTLSYEAGSAVSLNVHLSAAEELALCPATDSVMHHELLVRKLLRKSDYRTERPRPIPDEIVEQLAHAAATLLISDVLPRERLEQVSFEEILRFRDSTRQLRHEVIGDIRGRLASVTKSPEAEDLLHANRELQLTLGKELRTYRSEVAAARDKLWPTLVSSLSSGLVPGSLAAVSMNYIRGPGYALAASVVAGSLALLKGVLDLRAERRRAEESQSPAISYLSSVSQLR